MGNNPAKPNRTRRLAVALRIILTLALVALILTAIPLGPAWRATRDVLWLYVFGALAATIASRVAFALRWHLLLFAAGVRDSFLHTLGLAFVGLFYNNFGPATLGGDVAKSYLAAAGHNAEVADVAASVLADRGIGLVSLVVLGFASSVILQTPQLRLALWFLIGTGLMAFALVKALGRRAPRTDNQQQQRPGILIWVIRASDKLGEVSRAVIRYGEHKLRLTTALLCSCLGIMVMGVAYQYWCLAFGFELRLVQATAIVVVSSIVGMLPFTINGLGLTDGAKIVLLGWAGMGHPDALAMAVLQRVASLGFSLIGAGLQFLRPNPSQGT